MSYYGDGGHPSSSSAQPTRYRDDAASSHSPPSSPGTATPVSTSAASSSFLSGSLYSAFGGFMRRLSSDPNGHLQPDSSSSTPPQDRGSMSFSGASSRGVYDDGRSASAARGAPSFLASTSSANNGIYGVYSPNISRTASPLRPPPLEPLRLSGYASDTPHSARLLTSAIAEEIRIMVPERLRIEEDWKLIYSLDQDGASLATLYEKTSSYDEHRIGFVLVVKDQEGGIFGAYLTEYPHPSAHYFGTGECFLWRVSVLAPLPPPPSADTTHLTTRSTTISAAQHDHHYPSAFGDPEPLIPGLGPAFLTPASSAVCVASTSSRASSASSPFVAASAASTQPPRSPPTQIVPPPPASPSIRFSAFPYSGVNEYFIYCEPHSLSVGGGDGKYGLWLDDSLEKGISSTCLTFGNQPLSDEGDKFGVLGVEVWVIGSRR